MQISKRQTGFVAAGVVPVWQYMIVVLRVGPVAFPTRTCSFEPMPDGQIHCSDSIELLLNRFLAAARAPVRTPLKPVVVVSPHAAMAQWLKLELSRHTGICASFRFCFPRQMVWDVVRAVAPGLAAEFKYQRGAVAWAIFAMLPEIISSPAAGLGAHFAPELGTDAAQQFQFAQTLADLFDQYTVYRPDLIRSWNSGAASDWQATLWQAVKRRLGEPDPVTLFDHVLAELEASRVERTTLPERVLVFGLSALPPIYARVLHKLAKLSEVHMFVFLPKKAYFEVGLGSDGTRDPIAIRERLDRVEEVAGVRLSRLTTELIRDFTAVLAIEFGDWQWDAEFAGPRAQGILGRVQTLLRGPDTSLNAGARGGNSHKENPPSGSNSDDSIQVHVCHTRLREIEVLHDHILKWFREDPSLQPTDIAVFAPDISLYQGYIEAVFGAPGQQRRPLPYRIVGRGLHTADPVGAALRMFFKLAQGRITAPELIEFMSLPAVRAKFDFTESDLGVFRRWLLDAGFRWALDPEHRAVLGFTPDHAHTLRSAMDRLLLGYAMDDEQVFAGLVPVESIDGDNAERLAKLVRFASTFTRAAMQAATSHTIGEWCALAHAVLGSLVADPDPTGAELARVHAAVAEIAREASAAGCERVVPAQVFSQRLELALRTEAETSIGEPAGITFASLLAAHTLPFRVICLIGMNDTEFPRPDSGVAFDHIRREPRPGDRSELREDRYVFLEALLNARARLYVSYIGRSTRDNSQIPPSPLVSELLEMLNEMLGVDPEPLVRHHKLHGFNPVYFEGVDPRFFSFSVADFDAASTAPDRKPGVASTWTRKGQPTHTGLVTVDDLVRFFKNPARAFLQTKFGMVVLPEPDSIPESEQFKPNNLTRYQLRDAALAMLTNGAPPEKVIDSLRASGRIPPAAAGTITAFDTVADLSYLVQAVRDVLGQGPTRVEDLETDLGRWRIRGRLAPLDTRGLVFFRAGKLRATDLLEVWIKHLLLCLVGVVPEPTSRMFGLDDSKESAVKTMQFRFVPEAGTFLSSLLELYERGLAEPVRFFPQTSLEFAERHPSINPKRTESEALEHALECWRGEPAWLRRKGEGADPYMGLCFSEQDLYDPEFQSVALAVYKPLLEALSRGDEA